MVDYISNELKKELPNVEIKTVDLCDSVLRVWFNDKSLGLRIGEGVPIDLVIKEIIYCINYYGGC